MAASTNVIMVAVIALALSSLAAARLEAAEAVDAALHRSGGGQRSLSSNLVRCNRENIFGDLKFTAGAAAYPAAAAWIKQQELFLEGSGPMIVSTPLPNVVGLVPGVPIAVNLFAQSPADPRYSLSPAFLPTFLKSADPTCALSGAALAWNNTHPNGPLLLYSGPQFAFQQAWQPQGFYFRATSAQRGTLLAAERLYDDGNRRNAVRSVTKAFASAAFMALVDAGLIGLDEPAAKYVPSFRTGEYALITFRQIMTHESGLPAVIDGGEALTNAKLTLQECAALIQKTYPLIFTPGTNFTYTELAFQVMGAAMEAASGLRYQEILRRYIFAPLGMGGSNVYNQAAPQGRVSNPNVAFGGITTPKDLNTFVAMLQGKGATRVKGRVVRVLSEASVAEILRPSLRGEGFITTIEPLDASLLFLVQSGLLPAEVATTVINKAPLSNFGYGLGVPLSGVVGTPGSPNATATSWWLIGSTCQVYGVYNYQSADPITVSGSCIQQNVYSWPFALLGYILS